MIATIDLEGTIKEIESKSRTLKWHRRKELKSPDATLNHGSGGVKLHQFTARDGDRQIFVYETIIHCPQTTFDPGCGYFGDSLEIPIPTRTEKMYGLAILRARKSMADYFEPSGIVVWDGTFAKPDCKGLLFHREEDDPRGKIRRVYDRVKVGARRHCN